MRLEKLTIFSRSKRKQFVLKLSSRISQKAHATKITVLANLIRAECPFSENQTPVYPINSKAIADQHMYVRLSYISLKCKNMP